ncbi:methionyl-tRNA formyltransferase [Crenothrix polyspora]|nr:formyltransferase family protein [Crenothrix polyspora]
MKIAYFGYDFFWKCLEYLLNNDNEIIKVFTYKTDNTYNFNYKITDLLSNKSIPVQFGKATENDIQKLVDSGCELIVSAAYPYKIPIINDLKGINIHPTLLPQGRGPWPLPYIILNKLVESGVTIHKLNEKFDSGDILIQGSYPVSEKDNLESISCKSQIVAIDILQRLMFDFDKYWINSKPQGEGSYWAFPSDDKQTIKWNDSVDNIDRIARAFGKLESTANFAEKIWVIRDLSVWKQNHNYEIGSVVHETNKEVVVAASDGLVCLRFFSEYLV